jgi:hypothetical protein
MWWQMIALLRRFGLKGKQHVALTHLEENMMLGFSTNDRQTQNRVVEGFRCCEVIDVDCGFDNGFDVQGGPPVVIEPFRKPSKGVKSVWHRESCGETHDCFAR